MGGAVDGAGNAGSAEVAGLAVPRFGVRWFGMARIDMPGFGMARIGLPGFGLPWFGVRWLGKTAVD